ncbi:MAG: hypothetical protein ACRDV3_08010 [Acidothermaceae bacterium]
MKRHAPDWTSFVAGLLFCGIAIAYLSSELANRTLEVRWVAPIVLIGLGFAGLAGTLVRARTTSTTPTPPTSPPTPTPTPTPTQPSQPSQPSTVDDASPSDES